MKRREKELERESENSGERSTWEERVHRETRVLKVRRGGRRRENSRCGNSVARIADTEITDAGIADVEVADAGFASREW